MRRFGCATLSQLQDRVLHEPALFPALLDYLTVQVSEMFRDPAYFRALREQVVPLLRTYPSLKVWVAGCSTGEEVYSLAILLREEGLLERTLIYATDINPQALQQAAGRHLRRRPHRAASPRTTASPARAASLSDYYTAAYGGAVFDKSLREHIVFSDHSLATDSVFAEVQLVSCRNVLIYFDRELQDRAVGLFRDVAVPQGLSRHRREGVAALLGARRRLRRASPRASGSTRSGTRRDAAESLRGRIDAVVIGASAGGVEALSVLLPALPADCRAAGLRRRAPAARAPSLLAEIFAPRCALPVREAEDKEPIAAGHVYFAPPDYHLLVDAGPQLALSADEPVHFSRPVDRRAVRVGGRRLRRAPAGHHPDRRQRGRRGRARRRSRRAGGVTVVQEPGSAQAPLMAEAALQRGPADFVLPLDEIAALLATWPAHEPDRCLEDRIAMTAA